MINIYESFFNRNLKVDHLWIVKGESKEIKSTKSSGSMSIVIDILNKGTIFELLFNEIIDSNKI